jgi:poly(hydroxyalkanoate) depolymerase family esterase
MNTPLPPWMARATELTRAGRLSEATALIQSALQGTRIPPQGPLAGLLPADVIDVTARVVDAPEQAPSVASGNMPPPPAARQAPQDAAAFIAGRYTAAAGSRAYKVFVPPAAADRPLPLIVMLHGCTQDPDDFARGTGMNRLAMAEGFLVLYPEQARKANTSGCWNWFKHNHQRRGHGEPALLAGMVQECMQRYGVDPRRVYVAGLSAGGAMAAILGHTYPELFAAVGVHSGLAAGAAHDLPSALSAMQGGAATPAPPANSRPTIVFHGDQDTTVHPANGHRVVQACAGTSPARTERGHSSGGKAYTRHLHSDATGIVCAEHWVLHGAGHAWAGGSPQGTYTDAGGPDASREMLRFFLEHPHAPGGAGA